MAALDEPARPLLEAHSLQAGYARRPVLFDVSLSVAPGEIVALFGHNGAGKTTALNAIFGLVRPVAGHVRYDGHEITGRPCARNVRDGLTLIPAQQFVFGELRVQDNLRLGATRATSSTPLTDRLDSVYETFPLLGERRRQVAGTLSGGQQRMLSVGIALMADPRLLLLDEPSLGLSPAFVEQIMAAVAELRSSRGLSVLMIEQNVGVTLPVVDRAYFMRAGRIILEGTSEELRERESYWDLF